ncbi:MAG: aminoacyl-tRNA hydrolase [Heliobacteriaceae bacterium]|jgi:PTH1 family peptidyl-tRNA hydrolase|nr:aminoacyl-tRNA hydrolase [Heliobacteriaceae bacterium]
MKLIVGLGNIGDKYVFTRHNAGFMVLDMRAAQNGLNFKRESRLKGFTAKSGQDIMLAKPTVFMNLSGEAVRSLIDYYKIDIEDILIIHDDLSLDFGTIRFRADGSDGGHNGIKSVIKHLGTKNFARLKIGIGPQPSIPSETFVLQNFPKEQHNELKAVLKKSVEALEFYLANGMEQAQNKYN